MLRHSVLKYPQAAIFFSHDPNKLIVACWDEIFVLDASTQSTLPFSNAPQGVYYNLHALALSDDDTLLVAGCHTRPFSVSGYDTVSRTRLWIHNAVDDVGAVCMLGAYVIVTVWGNSTLVLDHKTGAQIASLQKTEGSTYGLGVVEGSLSFFLGLTSSDPHTSVYLAMLQHLLYKQATCLHLPLEMWDWIAKYRV